MQRSLREIAWVGSRTRATPNWRQTGWRRSSHRATGLVRCWRRWVSGSTRASGSSGCLIPSVPTRGSTVRTGPCRSWDRTRSWTPRMSSQAFAVRCVTSCSPFDFNSFSWGGRTRTSNFPVNSRAVCQLTYTPMLDAQTHRRTAAQRSTGVRSQENIRPRDRSVPGAWVHDQPATLRPHGPQIGVTVAIRVGQGACRHRLLRYHRAGSGASPEPRAPNPEPLVFHPALLGERLQRGFLLGGQVLGNLDVDLDVLIAPPSVPLDPLTRDAEALTVRCAGRHLQHNALAVERPHFDLRAEQRLRQIDRHDADDVEPVPSEKAVGLDLDRDHDVAPSLGPLPLEPQPRAVFRAGRDRDREPLLDPHLARPVTGGTRLRRDAPPAPAHGARPRNGEPALAERNGAAAFTFGTRREGGARCAARPAAGRAYLRQREGDGHPATQGGDPERDR